MSNKHLTIVCDLPEHVTARVSGRDLDLAIRLHLPASINELRTKLEAVTGSSYTDVDSVSELLILLAYVESNR